MASNQFSPLNFQVDATAERKRKKKITKKTPDDQLRVEYESDLDRVIIFGQ